MIGKLVRIVGVLVALVVVALLGAIGHGYMVAHQHVARRVLDVHAPADSAHVARGAYIARAECAGCHASGTSLALSGGSDNMLAIPHGPTFGVARAPNLTPGGLLAKNVSDGQLARAIREGIGVDGRALLIMPSAQLHRLSDDDLVSVIAYLRSEPAVTNDVPRISYNALGYLVLGLHMFPMSVQPAIEAPVASIPRDSTVAYGEYMSYLLGCRDCHGATLHGGTKGQFPPLGPNLAALAAAHPQIVFDRAIRGGVSPTGKALDPMQMPWTQFTKLDDLDVAALYRYLKSL